MQHLYKFVAGLKLLGGLALLGLPVLTARYFLLTSRQNSTTMAPPSKLLKILPLFGGFAPWRATDWTASDDRVRGGSSHSYLDIVPIGPASYSTDHKPTQARFYGTLDTHTLGGAGFASQRTITTTTTWDLSDYSGIELLLGLPSNTTAGAARRYTFNIKDDILDVDPETGRERSTVSWEADFTLPERAGGGKHEEPVRVYIPWNGFTPTYRGREKKDAGKLNLAAIKRYSIMMRSFFDQQEGDFELFIVEIRAIKEKKGDRAERFLGSVLQCLGWKL